MLAANANATTNNAIRSQSHARGKAILARQGRRPYPSPNKRGVVVSANSDGQPPPPFHGLWEDAKDRADKLAKLIDTQARPVGDELFGFARADFDRLVRWVDGVSGKAGGAAAAGANAGNKRGSDGEVGGAGRRKWYTRGEAPKADAEASTAATTTIDVETD